MDGSYYTLIPNPEMHDLQKAAYRFTCIARAEGFQIAFIGGFAAKMMGSDRKTRGLDVLIEPKFFENWEHDENSFGRRIVRRWMTRSNPQNCVYLAEAEIPAKTPNTPPTKWPIVVSHTKRRKGIALYPYPAGDATRFFGNLTEGYISGTAVLQPYSPMQLQLKHYKEHEVIPVLQALALIEQRLRHFYRRQIQDEESTKRDIADIRAFLDFAVDSYDPRTQTPPPFLGERGLELLPLVRKMLGRAEAFEITTTLAEVNKWRSVNVPLGVEDLRNVAAHI